MKTMQAFKSIGIVILTGVLTVVLAAAMYAAAASVPANGWIAGGVCTHGTSFSGPSTKWTFKRTLATYPIHEHQYTHSTYAYPFWIPLHDDSAVC